MHDPMERLDRRIEVLRKLIERWRETPKHGDGSILGSMTTAPDPIAVFAYNLFIHTNLADPVIFKTLKLFEEEVFNGLRKIYGYFESGLVTAGGSESNFLAILSAYRSRNGREKVVLAPDTVHVSVDKACEVLSLRLIKIPTGNEPVDPAVVEDYVRKFNPLAVVITAGTTELGLIDPVEEVSKVAYDTQTYLHVDAAYGGLLIPFLHRRGYVNVDLRFYEGVSSITVDFHKNGLTPIPSSTLLFKRDVDRRNVFFLNEYSLGGYTYGILGTRPGGSVAAIWAVWSLYGEDGFEELAVNVMEKALYLYHRLREIKGLIVYKPSLPIVVFKHVEIDYIDLLEALMKRGFYLYKSPSLKALRIVVMPHVTKKHIDRFINALKELVH